MRLAYLDSFFFVVVFVLVFAVAGLHRPPIFGWVCIIKGDGDQFRFSQESKTHHTQATHYMAENFTP